MTILNEAARGRRGEGRSSERQPNPPTDSADFVGRRVALAWVMGPGSVVDFTLADVDALPGRGCDLYEVTQQLDLSCVTASNPISFHLKCPHGGRDRGWSVVAGFYPFDEHRFTLIRYASLRVEPGAKLADILVLDCAALRDARGAPISNDSLMLLRFHGHGSSGSIQLVSRSLGLRLLESYPSIYSR